MGQIKYSKNGFTGKIIISNPKKKNAVTYEMWKEFGSVLDNVKSDQDLRLLIIEGEGDNFSAGADISQFSDLRCGEKRNEYDRAIYSADDKLKKLLIPVIASVKGVCFGGGFALALKCDFRIAEEDAVFSLPAVKRGLGYNKENIKDLVDAVGLNNARDILLTGRKVYYPEAVSMGLVSKNFIEMIVENAPLSIKAVKAGLLEIRNISSDDFSAEDLVDECFFSEDYLEATNAFKEKRQPIFKGK